jgi:hypothetical protein
MFIRKGMGVFVTGTLDPVTHAIDASEVEVISNDKFYFGGLLTCVTSAGYASGSVRA